MSNEELKITRGLILKELRSKTGKSQSDVAKSIGITQQVYQNYEAGRREASYDTLIKLADFYGVSIDYLLGRTSVKQMATEQSDSLEDIDSSELTERIVMKYTKLSENMRTLCMEMFRQISAVMDTEIKEIMQQEPTTRILQTTQSSRPFEKIARNGKRTILSDEEVEKLHALDDDEPPNLN
ncbi:MAG: helix-turn-helix domain-containing protein [Ruminococcus sp.]|nr:helix-turn-helix domain-containing protein [Ruminococcus sp.]